MTSKGDFYKAPQISQNFIYMDTWASTQDGPIEREFTFSQNNNKNGPSVWNNDFYDTGKKEQ